MHIGPESSRASADGGADGGGSTGLRPSEAVGAAVEASEAVGAAGAVGAEVSAFRAHLASLDVAHLTDAARLQLLAEMELLTRAVAGVSVQTQVAFHTSQVASQVEAGVAPSRAGRAVPDDLALARRTSPYWGSRELTSAKALVAEMPRTLAALEKGEISLYQSRVVTEATACLDPADRAEVDRRLAEALAGASTAEIGAAVRGLVYEVDPTGYVDRARKAAKDRGVSIRPCPDVMALLSARLPAPQAIACYKALKDKAVAMQASGDPRTLGQLMADLLFERLTGRSVVDGVDVEVGVVITDSALFDGTSEAADLVGYGPVPADVARDLLRPEGGQVAVPGSRDEADPDGETPEVEDPDDEDSGDEGSTRGRPTEAGRRSTCPDQRGHDETGQAPPLDSPQARSDGNDARPASNDTRPPGEDPEEVCPDGPRCASWSCPLLHGAPEASPGRPQAGPGRASPSHSDPTPESPKPKPPGTSAATRTARVWLRRLYADPATGVLTGQDTHKRLFTGSLRAALVARDKTCRNVWCGAPIRAIDHKIPARDGGPTSAGNGQGLCQRCNNAREHPRAAPPAVDGYRSPPPLLPTFLKDRAPPSAA